MQLPTVIFAFLYTLVVLCPISTASTPGQIVAPRNGAKIAPGASFAFHYTGRADYGVSSYNYTVWLFTALPTSAAPSATFAEGHFFGRFSEPNYPANPYPKNPAPLHLVMPDFSKNPGGFGAGASTRDAHVYLAVLEEYATGAGSIGFRISMAMNQIIYNHTTTL